MDVELIRPQLWLQAFEISVGKPLPLNIHELQIEGFALVTVIEPCPAISSGEGSVVTGRFVTRQVAKTIRLVVADSEGHTETIEGTAIHPFWSLDRHDWVPMGELLEGEHLSGRDGPVTVLTTTIANHPDPVYNIEVNGEHVYEISRLGLMVHNSCIIDPSQLQSKFKHAGDFGVTGNPNKTTLKAFGDAIQNHVDDAGTAVIRGTYRGNSVDIFVNPTTGLTVLTDLNNNFISGWKLSAQQLWHVLNGGKLGGG